MSSDTTRVETPDAESVAVFRSKSVEERLQIAAGMWLSARTILSNVLRQQHPDWHRARIDREVARRLSHGSV